MAVYEGTTYTMPAALSTFLTWEGERIHTREQISLTTAVNMPAGLILEETGGVWAKASACTGKLGMLVTPLVGGAEAQDAVVVTKDACFSLENLQVEEEQKETAVATLAAQGVKVA